MMKRFALFFLLLPIFSFPAFADVPAPEPAKPVGILYGPYLQNVTESGATIVWVTDKPAVSWVETAPDNGSDFYGAERPKYFQTHLGKKNIGTLHKVAVDGLERGIVYRYRICSQEVLDRKGAFVAYGRVASSNVYSRKPLTFRTLDPDKNEISFLVLNDIHENNELQAELMAQADPSSADFVIFNGDMAHSLNSEEQMFTAFMQTASKLYAAETPVFYARGNHETRGEFSGRFMDYFPTPTGLPYYTFREGPAFFVVLDGGEDKPDSDVEYYGTAAYDSYRAEEVRWLEDVLASEEFRSAPVKIAILHIPPVEATWYGAIEVSRLFVPLLNRAGIDIMFSGHLHRHIYVPAGTHGCKFPVLVNSNRDVVKCRVSGDRLNVRVIGRDGKTVREFDVN